MTGLILHHDDAFPDAKIKALMGVKDLSRSSVLGGPVAPKTNLLSLTGGCRRVPVLQIGAQSSTAGPP